MIVVGVTSSKERLLIIASDHKVPAIVASRRTRFATVAVSLRFFPSRRKAPIRSQSLHKEPEGSKVDHWAKAESAAAAEADSSVAFGVLLPVRVDVAKEGRGATGR